MNDFWIAPSILSADFARLGEEVQTLLLSMIHEIGKLIGRQSANSIRARGQSAAEKAGCMAAIFYFFIITDRKLGKPGRPCMRGLRWRVDCFRRK
jgi:hypothetical protein